MTRVNKKLNSAQRALFGLPEAGAASPVQLAARSGTSTAAGAKRKKGGGRRPKPQNLPVHREVIDLPEEQKAGLVTASRSLPKSGRSRSPAERAPVTSDSDIIPLIVPSFAVAMWLSSLALVSIFDG
jgi:hypothetical protein